MARHFSQESVISCREVAEGIFSLTLSWRQNETPQVGQFVALQAEFGVMPRPFSIVSFSDCAISLLIKVVGDNTRYFSKLLPGDLVRVSEPIGKPIFDITQSRVILVGGGIGAAALVPIFTELETREDVNLSVLLGAANESQLLPYFSGEPMTRFIAGDQGMVTDLLPEVIAEKEDKPLVIACGPVPMMAKVASLCEEADCLCRVIMEEIMACGGTGACKGCAVFGRDGSVKYACQDGPIFDGAWVDWSKFQKRFEFPVLSETRPIAPSLEITLVGQDSHRLILETPLMPASGCFEMNESGLTAAINRAGALVTKGLKLNPVVGNATPRVCETSGGMLNSIGLAGIGVDRFIAEQLRYWLGLDMPVIVNICGSTIEEYLEIARRLAETEVAGLEINVSCPNVKDGCMAFGVLPGVIEQLVSGVRRVAPDKFIIVKHTPKAMNDIVSVAKAARDGGADANCLANTFPGLAFDIHTRKAKLGAGYGGYSGPGILPLSLALIRQVHEANLGIPIIGCGGVNDPEGATQMILAGASAVQIGTGLFNQPGLINQIGRFWYDDYMRDHRIHSIQDLVGKGEI